LTAILGTTELMLEDLPTDDPDREGLLDIRSASERAAVFDAAAAHVQPPAGGVSPGAAAERPRPRARKVAASPAREDVAIRVAVAPDCGGVKADPGQLEQVIVNLA